MGKKRSQENNGDGGSEDSTESGDNYYKTAECSHLIKATNSNKLRKTVQSRKWTDSCWDCQKQEILAQKKKEEDEDEFSDAPPLWICLQCGHVACGRSQEQHAKVHYETPRSDPHCVVMDTQRWSVWCYKCDEAVSNRNPGHKKKILEVTEILKKWAKANVAVNQFKLSIPEYQSDIKLADSETEKPTNNLPKVGGLVNLGNTCFFNAVMQCLAQTPYLVKVLEDLQVPDQTFLLPGGKFKPNDKEEIDLPDIRGTLDNSVAITPVLQTTLTDMQNGDGQVYRPGELFCSLRRKTIQCTDGGQHDSHELLRHLLELVRNEDVRRYQSVILKENGLNEKTKSTDDKMKAILKFYGNKANAKFLGPERAFRGELVSTLQCLECNHTSMHTEPFLDLSLPVLADKSQPPMLKRKNNSFENSIDSMGNISSASNIPTKKELRKAKKEAKRKAKLNNKKDLENSNNLFNFNDSRSSEERKNSAGDSEESDADVEDNAENEDNNASQQQLLQLAPADASESGYSSEKASAVASPVFPLAEQLAAAAAAGKATIDSVDSAAFSFHSSAASPEGGGCPANNGSLNNSLASKESPTSPASPPDGEDVENVSKLVLKLDTAETQMSNDRDVFNKTNDEEETAAGAAAAAAAAAAAIIGRERSVSRSLSNGLSDASETATKAASPARSPNKYLTQEGECSIQSCLNQFTALELMTGNNKVGCAKCTARENGGKKEGVKMICTDSTKQYLISRVPAVLILHLKRFQVQKFSFRKVGKHVSFPMLLDLAPVCKDYAKPKMYALFGVVEHSGTMYGGHYVAYVKSRTPLKHSDPRWSFLPSKDGFESNEASSESNSEVEGDDDSDISTSKTEAPPGKWYYVSDSRVHEVDEKTVLSSEAYLLFYERIL